MDYNKSKKEKKTKAGKVIDIEKAGPSMDADKNFVDGSVFTTNDSPDDF